MQPFTNGVRSMAACPLGDACITCLVIDVSDAKRLKALEIENAKLKKLLAEQMMDVSTLKEMLAKNF